jgi:peroxiredoxin family protein
MKNVQEKMQAISAAQNAFATIESIRPGAIPHETKVLLAELKVDLMDIQDAQEDVMTFTGVTAEEIARAFG